MGQLVSPHLLGREFHHSWDSSLGECTAALRAGFRAPLLTRQGSHCLGTRRAASQSPSRALPVRSPRSRARRPEGRAALGGAAAAASTLLAASLLARRTAGGEATQQQQPRRAPCKLVRDAPSAFGERVTAETRCNLVGGSGERGAGRLVPPPPRSPDAEERLAGRPPAGAPAELGTKPAQPGLVAGRGFGLRGRRGWPRAPRDALLLGPDPTFAMDPWPLPGPSARSLFETVAPNLLLYVAL